MSQRWADTYNTASVPSCVVLNGMVCYRVNAHLEFQANLNNITNALYYNGVYYTADDENHAVPGPGRTLLLSARLRY